ncbi:carbohydrate kinase family protein [Paenibacillus sp. CF384]|uniref:carbohydrate kinase family protein n=1 Tax=Paenibacillus sp. CF384 TaxID=1884382 RepID=UPI00089D7997|nr:carbohydrate kinase family protein [Paenibacillus sp. CF384]SDW17393.1 Sugar or nucleoside kinase, ribokinase family [Paenibacillus sp. CF384]
MSTLRPVSGTSYRYRRLIGTGGIGSGILFQLEGNQTIGRNESRLGELTNNQDFCKLHIICHYPAVLLSDPRNDEDSFKLYPIGKVGTDLEGKALLEQLVASGMSTDYVDSLSDAKTLFSVCFQYPDLAGGNITTSNSASEQVMPQDINYALEQLPPIGPAEIVLAAPEVPLAARIALLEGGRARGSFNVAALLSSETAEFGKLGGFALTDLLSVNRDEARRIAELAESEEQEELGGYQLAAKCASQLSSHNTEIKLIMTDGAAGCYSFENGRITHTPPLKVEAFSTAGAGDALLGGVISGLSCGLPFTKVHNDAYFAETPLESAVELGTLIAALAVTSPHSIHLELNVQLLADFAIANEFPMTSAFRHMLGVDQ